jgi:alpha-D-xyloside xylohydrolase
VYSTITFAWDDAKRTLTISDRNGSFPGMLNERKFNIVIVTNQANKVVSYTGKKVVVKF